MTQWFQCTVVAATAALMVAAGQYHLAAQSPAAANGAAPPAFEVASIKPNKEGPRSLQRAGLPPGERVTMINVPLLTLIQVAYPGMSEITGGPGWMGRLRDPNFDADRFDVSAKAASPSSTEQLRLMLQGLLAERFKLAFHTEVRQADVYALRLATADRKLGPNIHPVAVDCRALIIAAAATNPTPGKSPCIDPAGPDIFTAVQEQLGLKFVAEKADQTTLVVDHVEPPTPD